MPKKYVKIRDALKRKGVSDKAAKRRAARIYNSRRKPWQKPVTRNSD